VDQRESSQENTALNKLTEEVQDTYKDAKSQVQRGFTQHLMIFCFSFKNSGSHLNTTSPEDR